MRRATLLCAILGLVLFAPCHTGAQSRARAVSPPHSHSSAPAQNPDSQKTIESVIFADLLPAILEKALASEVRRHVKALQHFKGVLRVWHEAGLVSPVLLERLEQELSQNSIRRLNHEAKFEDLLDTLSLRHKVPHRHMDRIEDTALSPLLNYFVKFDEALAEYTILPIALAKLEQTEPSKIRQEWREFVANAPHFRWSTFGKKMLDYWGSLARKNPKELRSLEQDVRRERMEILDEKADLEVANKALPEDKVKRLAVLDLELDVLAFENGLRAYETLRPPDDAVKKARYERRRAESFSSLIQAFAPLQAPLWRTRSNRCEPAGRGRPPSTLMTPTSCVPNGPRRNVC